MRFLLLAAALLAVPALAQEPVPDSVDWHRYAPLAVGNAWQYAVDTQVHPTLPVYETSYHAVEIVGEVLVNDTSYFEAAGCSQGDDEPPTCDGAEGATGPKGRRGCATTRLRPRSPPPAGPG